MFIASLRMFSPQIKVSFSALRRPPLRSRVYVNFSETPLNNKSEILADVPIRALIIRARVTDFRGGISTFYHETRDRSEGGVGPCI